MIFKQDFSVLQNESSELLKSRPGFTREPDSFLTTVVFCTVLKKWVKERTKRGRLMKNHRTFQRNALLSAIFYSSKVGITITDILTKTSFFLERGFSLDLLQVVKTPIRRSLFFNVVTMVISLKEDGRNQN